MFYQLMVHTVEAYLLEQIHALAPRGYVLVGMDERERNPTNVPFSYFLGVFQRHRARGKVPGVGIFLVALKVELLKVGI